MSNSIQIVKTNSENVDFIRLVAALDKSLWERYPNENQDYWENNILEINPNVVLIYRNDKAVACACFKKYDVNTIEIKRMFVSPEARGMGLAQRMLSELELQAQELGYSAAVLETLHKQQEAIGLYQKVGYSIIDNYEPYLGLKDSICMQKKFSF